jgi:hypothetical protein
VIRCSTGSFPEERSATASAHSIAAPESRLATRQPEDRRRDFGHRRGHRFILCLSGHPQMSSPTCAVSLAIRSDKALFDDGLAAWSSAVRGRESLRGREGRILQIAFRGRALLFYSATIGHPAASPIPASAPMRLTSSQIAAAGAGATSGQHDRTFGRVTVRPHCWQSQTKQSEANRDNCGF